MYIIGLVVSIVETVNTRMSVLYQVESSISVHCDTYGFLKGVYNRPSCEHSRNCKY